MPNLYLLAIGVSEYQDPALHLAYAHKDAQDLTQVLQQQQGQLYRKVETKVLTNQDASHDQIFDGLDWMLKNATQKDLAMA